MRLNDLAFVRDTLRLLRARGTAAWVFGGWAEELHGSRPARPHVDLDLLVRAPISTGLLRGLGEIRAKRFRHKRAFVLHGIMVELFLVEADSGGLCTHFWTYRHEWPDDTLAPGGQLPLASATAVAGYRRRHHLVERARAAARRTPGDRPLSRV